MGDIIEFVTSPSHGRMCFKITSSGVNFDVKTHGYASVGLSRKPGRKYDILVTIGTNNMTWIGENIGDGVQASTPDILSAEEFTRFWLLWTGNVVSIGKYGHVQPILTYPSKSPKYMYVSFLSYEGYHSVNWKVELPPTLKEPFVKHVSKGDLRWVSVDRQLPDDALIGGFEKENLYIIRAKHRGSLTPGKFVPSEGSGYIAWGGEVHEKENLEVLCGYNCKWVPTGEDRIPVGAVEAGYSEVRREVLYVARALYHGYNIPGKVAPSHKVLCGYNCKWVPTGGDRIPVGAVEAGYSEVRREVLYVGRSLYGGNIVPGKVQPSHKVCYIPYTGREIATEYYEILTVPTKWPCANKYILPNEDVHYNVEHLQNEDFNDEDDEDGPIVNEYWMN